MIISLSSKKQVYLDSYFNKFKSLERQYSNGTMKLSLESTSKKEGLSLLDAAYECIANGIFQDKNIHTVEIDAPLYFRVLSTNNKTVEFLRERYVVKTNNTR